MSNSQEKSSPISPRRLLEAEFVEMRNKFFITCLGDKQENLGEVNLNTDYRYGPQGEFVGGTPEFYYDLAATLLRWLPAEMLTEQIEVYKKNIDTLNEIALENS